MGTFAATSYAGIWVGSLVAVILAVAGWWAIFAKAGRPGWGAIIPIYNTYLTCKVAGRPGWWLLLLLIPFVNIVIMVIVLYGVAKHFGKGVGYTIGLIVLPVIFPLILGFGSATYQGEAQAA